VIISYLFCIIYFYIYFYYYYLFYIIDIGEMHFFALIYNKSTIADNSNWFRYPWYIRLCPFSQYDYRL